MQEMWALILWWPVIDYVDFVGSANHCFLGFEDISVPPFFLFELITSVRRRGVKPGMFSRLFFPIGEMPSDGNIKSMPSAFSKATGSTEAAL